MTFKKTFFSFLDKNFRKISLQSQSFCCVFHMNIWRRIKTLFVAVTPEPDSTEDSTGGLEPPEVPHVPHRIPGKSPTRRMSQPVTGSPKDQDKSTNRRASEGEYQFFQSLADLDNAHWGKNPQFTQKFTF